MWKKLYECIAVAYKTEIGIMGSFYSQRISDRRKYSVRNWGWQKENYGGYIFTVQIFGNAIPS